MCALHARSMLSVGSSNCLLTLIMLMVSLAFVTGIIPEGCDTDLSRAGRTWRTLREKRGSATNPT